METKTKIILVVVGLAGAFAAGRFTLPAKIVEKEHIVYQDRVVEKKVYVKDTTTKKNIVTVRLTTIKPDGTRTIETKTYDKSTIDLVQNTNTAITDNKQIDTTKEKTTTYDTQSLLISAAMKLNVTASNPGVAYGLTLNKRVLGPFYLGAFAFTDATVGMSVGIAF